MVTLSAPQVITLWQDKKPACVLQTSIGENPPTPHLTGAPVHPAESPGLTEVASNLTCMFIRRYYYP